MPSLLQCIDASSGEKDGAKPSHPDWAAGWSERLTGMWLITHRLRKGDAINFQGWDLLHWIQYLEFSRKLWKQTWDYSTAIRNSSSLFSSPRTLLPNFFYLFFSLCLNTNLCSKLCCTISLQQALTGAQGSLHPGPDCLISWQSITAMPRMGGTASVPPFLS